MLQPCLCTLGVILTVSTVHLDLGRVIGASDGEGLPQAHVPAGLLAGEQGSTRDAAGRLWAWHRTPGDETYRGLGWVGVITQAPQGSG
jgi:hypothetical protein